MKRTTYIPLSALAGVLVLLTCWRCRQDEEDFRPYPNTLTAVDQLIRQVPDPSVYTAFRLSGAIPDTVLNTGSGMQIQLTDAENLFADENGAPVPCSVCDEVLIELTEIRKKGDMVAYRLHTAGDDGSLLDAVAVVDFRVSCDGKPLTVLNDRNVLLRLPVSGASLTEAYRAVFPDVDSTVFKWNLPGEPAFFAEWPVQSTLLKGYELVLNQTGRVACARLLDAPSVSTFCVQLDAPPYNNQNTRMYLVFEGANSVVELHTVPGTNHFCYDFAPLGYPVQVVSLSNTNSGFELGNYKTEIGTNSETPLDPVIVSEQELIDFLRAL